MAKPEYFYKYITAEVALKILSEGKVRFSASKTLNDPFDAKLPPDFYRSFSRTEEQWREVIKKRVQEIIPLIRSGQLTPANPENPTMQLLCSLLQKFPELEPDEIVKRMNREISTISKILHQKSSQKITEDLRKLFDFLCIFCVSEAPDSLVMWLNYANSHRGAVIRFKHLMKGTLHDATKVKYADTLPPFRLTDFVDFLLGVSDNEITRRWIKSLVETKRQEWEYEKEWRVILVPEEGDEFDGKCMYRRISPEEIDEIIFGYRIGENCRDCRDELTKLIKGQYPHASILEAELNHEKSALDFKTIHQGTGAATK